MRLSTTFITCMRTAGVAGAILVTVSTWAQSSQTGEQKPLANGNLIHSLLAEPVINEPYTATATHSVFRTLADGSTISHKGHHFVARDAEGRVRVEMRLSEGSKGEPDEVAVFVIDPVSHTLTTWVSGAPEEKKVASVVKLAEHSQEMAALRSDQSNSDQPGQPKRTTSKEDLGTQTIDGLEVSDQRTTTIVPIGRSGNSAPIKKTHEVWISPELQLIVKEQWMDPRTGQRTVELKDLSRANPDPKLFQPPNGYQVVDAVQSLKQMLDKMSAEGN